MATEAGARYALCHVALDNPASVRRSLEAAVRQLRRDVWAKLPDERALSTLPLELDPSAPSLSAGSLPQVVLLDRQGRRYLFKMAPPDQIAAELFACRVRATLGCLHVPAGRRTFVLPELGEREGLVQPVIAHQEGRLAPDAKDWPAVSVEHLLREHPWEWFLANLDTHVDQYLLVGPQALPINIDWDHALLDLAVDQLDRFNMRSAAVAPIRNLFYAEYVAGLVPADFYGMRLEARRIDTGISDPRLVKLVRSYCDELALPADQRKELSERLVERKRRLPSAFDRFARELDVERRESRGMPSQKTAAEQLETRVRDAWQRLVITVMHDNVVRPTLKAYRVVRRVGERVFDRPTE